LVFTLLVLTVCVCGGLPFLGGIDPLEPGTEAPSFSLPTVAGDTASLADFEGEIVLLNFWSST
jgi:hypothetical protein